jgi:hypothetical protein
MASHRANDARLKSALEFGRGEMSEGSELHQSVLRAVLYGLTELQKKAQLFERILNEKPHPEMGYRSCLGIIRLAQQYSRQRVAAAERALLAQACRYQSVKSILKNSLDAVPLSPPQPGSPPLTHDNVRGAEYFDQGGPTSC